jgi:hypothetical protein
MTLSNDDQRLVDAGLLTAREASRLPQWAKMKILRLARERDEARDTIKSTREANPGATIFLNDMTGERVPVGGPHARVELKLPDSPRLYDVSMYMQADGTIEVIGGHSLHLSLRSSNHFIIRLDPKL